MGSSFYNPRIKDNGDESLEGRINRDAKRMAKARDKGDDERFLFLKERHSLLLRFFSKVAQEPGRSRAAPVPALWDQIAISSLSFSAVRSSIFLIY